METQKYVLKTIESLKKEISFLKLQLNEYTQKLLQIETIVQNQFSEISYFDINDNFNYNRIKELINEEFEETYYAFNNVTNILDTLIDDD